MRHRHFLRDVAEGTLAELWHQAGWWHVVDSFGDEGEEYGELRPAGYNARQQLWWTDFLLVHVPFFKFPRQRPRAGCAHFFAVREKRSRPGRMHWAGLPLLARADA